MKQLMLSSLGVVLVVSMIGCHHHSACYDPCCGDFGASSCGGDMCGAPSCGGELACGGEVIGGDTCGCGGDVCSDPCGCDTCDSGCGHGGCLIDKIFDPCYGLFGRLFHGGCGACGSGCCGYDPCLSGPMYGPPGCGACGYPQPVTNGGEESWSAPYDEAVPTDEAYEMAPPPAPPAETRYHHYPHGVTRRPTSYRGAQLQKWVPSRL